MITDKVFRAGSNYPVNYRFKVSNRDCNHLLIVMSGFNVPDPTIYDFENALMHCDSYILWIKDDFRGKPAYYLCNQMSFEIEDNVSDLIKGVISFLKNPNVSIMGASKGGSMALYYGIKHNISHIVSVVPQFNIGSYVANGTYWEHIGQEMMGEITEDKIKILNNKIIDMISNVKNKKSNIYLFTSPNDHQYESEILPNIDVFSQYEKFNLIVSKSEFITQHSEVASFNIKLLLSLIYQFEHGISPEWGIINNGGDW